MQPKIVIIGAGVAGISAACKLIQHGMENFVILEAEERIGGRINTVPFGSNFVDLGAQWCHGEQNNIVYKLSKDYFQFGSTSKKYEAFNCIRSNGEVISKVIVNKLIQIVQSIKEEAKVFFKSNTGSQGEFLYRRFEKALKIARNSDIDDEIAREFIDFVQKFENSIEACETLFEVSGSGLLEYWECKGDPLLSWKDKGYITYLNILMGIYPDSTKKNILNGKIIFCKKVKNINWDRLENRQVLITCCDGDQIQADHVICTVSLGVLKESQSHFFTPILPNINLRAIQGLSIGTVNKVFLEFLKPFWPKGWNGFNPLWKQNDLLEIRCHKQKWLENIFGFYTVDNQPNIICAWISGSSARIFETSDDKDMLEGLMSILKKFLSYNIPDPIAYARSNWFSNPNFRGSYSFRSMHTEQLNTSSNDLATPVYRNNLPVILFAGEATSDHYYSTVHGASESGFREAERLIKFFKSQNTFVDKNNYDVVILGAGLAGLGAGCALKNSKLKYCIIEAQDYLGGRVKSKCLQETHNSFNLDCNEFVDLGAQWLHGEQNELYKIAVENDLLVSEISEEGLGSYINEKGQIYNKFMQQKVDYIVGKILTKCEDFRSSKKYPISVGFYLREKFEEYIDKEFSNKNERQIARQLLNWHINFQLIDNSCLTLDELSAKYWGLYSFNGETCQSHINFRKGFGSIINCIAKDIDDCNIYKNMEVININWNIKENKNQMIVIETVNNMKFFTKFLIVTFSLGVLKAQESTIFTPLLPNCTRNLIQDLGFETINKIFLQFDKPWWEPMEGIQLVFSENLPNLKKWTHYISGFDVLKPGPTNTLVAWVGGFGAIEMESMKDDEIIIDCIDILSLFTKRNVPNPIRFNCSRWGTNKFIKGGYSYISTKCDKTKQTGVELLQPITYEHLSIDENFINKELIEINRNVSIENHYIPNERPLIYFAGEACHEKYFSTAHGAFLSGIKQAQKLLSSYYKFSPKL